LSEVSGLKNTKSDVGRLRAEIALWNWLCKRS